MAKGLLMSRPSDACDAAPSEAPLVKPRLWAAEDPKLGILPCGHGVGKRWRWTARSRFAGRNGCELSPTRDRGDHQCGLGGRGILCLLTDASAIARQAALPGLWQHWTRVWYYHKAMADAAASSASLQTWLVLAEPLETLYKLWNTTQIWKPYQVRPATIAERKPE